MKKILLVDDSSTSLMHNRMILAKGAWEIITARDGQQAVAMASQEKPDLIVMDVMMPNLDGFGALRLLRGSEQTRGVPVIMVTTRSEADHIERGYETGCSDYVTKPVNGAELLAKVRNHLGE